MRLHLSLAAALLIPQLLAAEEPKLDAYGDLLPAGAIARLGTVRLRHTDFTSQLAFLPDGKVLISVGEDGTLRHWDAATGKELKRIQLYPRIAGSQIGKRSAASGMNWSVGYGGANPRLVRFTAEGGVIAVDKGEVEFLDTTTGKEIRKIKPDLAAWTPVLSADGNFWAGASGNNTISIWNVQTSERRATLGISQSDGFFRKISLSADGRLVAAARTATNPDGNKMILTVHAVESQKEIYRSEFLDQEGNNPTELLFSPDGRFLAWDPSYNSIQLLEIADGKVLRELRGKDEPAGLKQFVLAAEGKSLVAYNRGENAVRIFDTATGKETRKFAGPQPIRHSTGWLRREAIQRGMALSSDGKRLALSTDGQNIRLLDMESGKELEFSGHQAQVDHVAFGSTGKTLSSWGSDGTVRTWDLTTYKEVGCGRVAAFSEDFAVSPDGRRAAVSQEFALSLRSATTGGEIRSIRTPKSPFLTFAFTPDSRTILFQGVTETELLLGFYDTATGKEIRVVPMNLPTPVLEKDNLVMAISSVACPQYSPDGSMAAVLVNSSTLGLYDSETGRERARIEPAGRRPILGTTFAPDGKAIALDLGNEILALWEIATAKERRIYGRNPADAPVELNKTNFPHTKQFAAVFSTRAAAGAAISPDGRLLAQSCYDGSIRIWATMTGKELGKLTGHDAYVSALAFSPDGKTLASGSRDTTVLLWDVSGYPAKSKPEAKAVDVAARWADLLSPDAAKAFDSICLLVVAPDKTVPFLKKNARPAIAPDTVAIQGFIADLDSEEFEVRKQANEELTKLGEAAIPLIRTALQGDLSPEARKRLEALLAKEPRRLPTGETLRSLRAIEVLEMIGTPEAKTVLEGLAKGSPGATVTQAAKESLQRMKR
jgi:WD40 repeat protein